MIVNCLGEGDFSFSFFSFYFRTMGEFFFVLFAQHSHRKFLWEWKYFWQKFLW